ncbi:hypothetical protein [Nocardioides albus]|uniref:Uncharacterized protein n=1 Tax=Nocardioides albus TaxID=1841 RepID=A0A7W5FBB2_9ACTN|nr:hypothetical protein [Nocardioides albus]MBB3092169.1 hypothetical protein [Nocardioides albus]
MRDFETRVGVTPITARAIALDEWLFRPSSWFAIDDANQQVRGVRPATLSAGLDLVGRGRVRALVGRLRRGAAVADVDVDGGLGEYAAREIASWAHLRGYWTLLRPSGGGDGGRHHVFLAHPDLSRRSEAWAEVQAYLSGVAVDIGVAVRQLDLRDAVRPLSSPHRHGVTTRAYGDLGSALSDLRKILPEPPAPETEPRPRRIKPTPTEEPPATAGPRRPLRPQWQAYLTNGTIPAHLQGDPGGHKRSLIEAQCTLELAWAGHTEQSAWRQIRGAHAAAMTKARGTRYQWWSDYVWTRAVQDRDTFAETHGIDLEQPEATPRPVAEPSTATVHAVTAARDRLQELLWRQPTRARAAVGLVGHTILDRISRTADADAGDGPVLRVPCPERDLALDTGISDRKTIRAALRLLDGTVGTLHRDGLSHAHALRASTSYEFSIDPAIEQGVREIPPPKVSHPPQGLWGSLPRSAHALWRALLQGDGEGSAIAQLAIAAALVPTPGQTPTRSQLDTTITGLQALSRAGLARLDEHGRWHASTIAAAAATDPDLLEHAARRHEQLHQQVTAERATYRSPQPVDEWTAGRARAYKAQLARQKAWWDTLDPVSRAQRQRAKRAEFDQLTITDQARLKEHLARRRAHAGITEIEHHQGWLDSLSPDQYAHRSHRRRDRYDRLPQGEKALSVEAWDRHRRRHGLPEHQASPPADAELDLLPDGRGRRDTDFLTEAVGAFGKNQPAATETLIPDWALPREGSAS